MEFVPCSIYDEMQGGGKKENKAHTKTAPKFAVKSSLKSGKEIWNKKAGVILQKLRIDFTRPLAGDVLYIIIIASILKQKHCKTPKVNDSFYWIRIQVMLCASFLLHQF